MPTLVTMALKQPIPLLLSAGEASGDMYAARLAAALQQRTEVTLFGMGGPKMRAAGVETIVDYSEVAVVGITEVIRHLPAVLRAMRQLVQEAERRQPALAILTDFPGFHMPLAKKLHARNISNVYYICPQFWAWRPWRVRAVRQNFVTALCIFPFEEKFFADAGVPTEFIGHPLVGAVHASLGREAFCAKHGLDASKPIVTVLPGSRASELGHHLPVLQQACAQIQRTIPTQFVLALASNSTPDALRQILAAGTNRTNAVNWKIVEGETYDALGAADAAIVSSGTATVETALLDVPMVVIYRVSPITAAVAKPLLRTPFVAMVNLIAEERVVPELVQGNFTPQRIAAEVLALLQNPDARATQRRGLALVRDRLGAPGTVERAADSIVQLLHSRHGNAK